MNLAFKESDITHGQMEKVTWENTKKIKNKGMEYTFYQTIRSSKGGGSMGNNTVWESILT